MNLSHFFIVMLVISVALPAAAQTDAPVQSAGNGAGAGTVTAYPAAFFAEYRPRTAQNMLDRVPGFDISDGDGGRGLGQGGNVLIDGKRPTTKSDSLGDILSRIQASTVERIDLIQGSAPGVDMQGYTVVANVIRKPGGGLKGSVAGHVFQTGGRGGYQLEGQAQKELYGHNFSGAFEYRDAYDPRETGLRTRTFPGGAVVVDREEGVENGQDYSATLSYEGPVGPGRLRATVVGRAGRDVEDSLEQEISPVPGPPEDDTSTGSYDEGELSLSYIFPLGSFAEAETTLIAQRNKSQSNSFFGASTFSQIRDASEIVGLAAVRFQPTGRWTLNGGAEVALNTLDTSSVLIGGGVTLPNPQITVEELRGEAFAAARLAYSPRLSFEFGMRYEVSKISTQGAVSREKTLSFPKPRFLATFARTPDEQMSLRIEREVDQLSFGDFSASVSLSSGSAPIAGNPDLEPGRAWVIEAEYERRFGKQGSFNLALAHQELEAIIATNVFLIGAAAPPPTPLPRSAYYEAADNIGDGTRDSIEMEVTVPLGRIGVPGGLLSVGLEREWTELIDPTTGERRSFNGASPYEWEVSLSQDIAAWAMRWSIDIGNEAPSRGFRPTELSRSREEPWVEVAVEKTFGPYWIRTGVNNATGAEETSERTVFDNPRGRGAVRFEETGAESESPFWYFLLRRTF